MSERFKEDGVRSRLVARMFNGKLVENRWRGDLVEELVYTALHPDGWSLCSGDWTSWDLRHEKSGLKIQVKQTARRQTWGLSPPTNRYAVKPVNGFYDGSAAPNGRTDRVARLPAELGDIDEAAGGSL